MNKPEGRPFNLMNKPPIAPGVIPGVKYEDLKDVKCKCGGDKFIPIGELRYASRLQTLTGGPMLVNFQGGYACIACSKINEFDTSDLPELKKEGEVPSDNGDGQENVIN